MNAISRFRANKVHHSNRKSESSDKPKQIQWEPHSLSHENKLRDNVVVAETLRKNQVLACRLQRHSSQLRCSNRDSFSTITTAAETPDCYMVIAPSVLQERESPPIEISISKNPNPAAPRRPIMQKPRALLEPTLSNQEKSSVKHKEHADILFFPDDSREAFDYNPRFSAGPPLPVLQDYHPPIFSGPPLPVLQDYHPPIFCRCPSKGLEYGRAPPKRDAKPCFLRNRLEI